MILCANCLFFLLYQTINCSMRCTNGVIHMHTYTNAVLSVRKQQSVEKGYSV